MYIRFSHFIASAALLSITSVVASPIWAQHSGHGTNSPVPKKQESTLKVGKQGELSIMQETQIGGRMLPAGEYRIKHLAQGEDHVIVVNQWNQSGSFGKEVARVECTLEPLGRKVQQSQFIIKRDEAGRPVITEIQVKGENVRHLL